MADIQQTKISWLHEFYGWTKLDVHYFSIEDYATINGNIQLIRIEPGIAKDHTYVATHVSFFGDFRLFQCDSPSQIRHGVPMRFFYSKKYGKVYELNGTNKPIYDMAEFIDSNEAAGREVFPEGDRAAWLKTNAEAYVQLFFDNVKGRHGRFEITSDYTALMNRLAAYTTYQQINNKPLAQVHKNKEEQVKYQQLIVKAMAAEKPVFVEADPEASADGKEDPADKEKSQPRLKNVFMFFKQSLFKVTVLFDLDDIGKLTLKDEQLVTTDYLNDAKELGEAPAYIESLQPIGIDELKDDVYY